MRSDSGQTTSIWMATSGEIPSDGALATDLNADELAGARSTISNAFESGAMSILVALLPGIQKKRLGIVAATARASTRTIS